MSAAMKLARKELTKLGAVVQSENKNRIEFLMPDGKGWTCSNLASIKHVREVVALWKERADVNRGDYLSRFALVVNAPSLAGARLRRTTHFQQRCDLMSSQGMRVVEVRDALMRPTSVREAGHGRLLYCRGRVAVVIALHEGVASAVTCLWTTRELWRENPRKERAEFG